MPISVGCPINLTSLIADCDGLTRVGGLYPFLYFCRRSEIQSIAYAPVVNPALVSDGSVIGITFVATAGFRKIAGRKFQNTSSFEMKLTPTGATLYSHKVMAKIFESKQVDRNAIAAISIAEDLVFFLPTNAGHVEIYGLGLGLKPTTGKGGSGLKLEDDSTFAFEFDGTERLPPVYFQSPDTTTPVATGQAASIVYLDALVNA